MIELRSTTLYAAMALLLAPLGGCSSQSANSFEATKAGAIMTELRQRHGGAERFRRFAGVVFSYRVQFRDQVRHFDRVGFRFANAGLLWVRRSPDEETLLVTLRERASPLQARPIKAIASASTKPEPSARPIPAGAPAPPHAPARRPRFPEPELDLALRSIPFLFEPSLTTSIGPWQYRTLLAPGRAENAKLLEVEPWASYPVDGHYLLERDSRTGLLKQILYRGTHPVVRGRTQLARFGDYVSAQGIKVARTRIHRRPVDVKERELRRNPFIVPSREREETFLSEWIDGIRFVTAAEADELLPLPAEGDDHKLDDEADDKRDDSPHDKAETSSHGSEPTQGPSHEPLRALKPLPLAFPVELAPRSATMTRDE